MPLKPVHKPPYWNQPKSPNASFGEDTDKYRQARWRKLRKKHLMANPLCVEGKKEGITEAGDVVDHIIPVRLGGEMYDENNLQTLCTKHHNSKSAKEGKFKRKAVIARG